MSDPKRPGQGGLFDNEDLFHNGTPANLFQEGAAPAGQPQSLFGGFTPPTPKQSIAGQAPAQGQATQRPAGQPAQQAGGQRYPGGQPQQQRPLGQNMPNQQAARPQAGQVGGQPRQPAQQGQARQGAVAGQQAPLQQAPAAGQQAPRQGAQGTSAAPQRPAAPAGQATQRPPAPAAQQPVAGQRPAAPGGAGIQGQPARQSPPNSPTQNRAAGSAAQAQNRPAQGQRAAQQQAIAGRQQSKPTGSNPNQNSAAAGGNGQVYRPADSGQRLSQFAPKPAAEKAESAAKTAQAASDLHTRIMAQPANASPQAGFGDATRVGQAVTPPQNGGNRPIAQNTVVSGFDAALGGGQGAGGGSRNGNGGNGRGPGGSNGAGGNGGGKKGKGGKKGQPKGKTVAKYVFINLGKFVLTCMCIGIIIASILFVQVASYVVESTANDDLTLDLDAIASSQTGYMWAKDANGEHTIEYLQIIGESNFRWASLSEISPYVKDALISTEDKQFYEHNGVSWGRTAYAALNEVLSLTDNQFGASTITQQLVKNLTGDAVVTDAESGASAGYMRKMREIFRAIGINNSYSKEMVLEAYLNTMPLTGTIVGVGAGAYEYFGKSPAELELHEAAMIVGITNWPTKYSPYSKPENCMQRRNDVLYFMYEDGKITKAEFDAACEKPLGLVSNVASNQVEVITTWYADAAIEQVLDDLADALFDGKRDAASSYFYNAGLNIELNVDLRVQEALEQMYLHGYDEDSPWPDISYTPENGETARPQSAMTIMDYDGNVLASVGGIGQKTVSRALNRASMSPRQVGSTMKAIAAYVLGVEYDLITYSTNLMDSYCWYENNNPNNTGPYDWPNNFGSITNSSMGVYTAVAQSTNTVAVRVGLAVGNAQMYDFAVNTMGLTYLQPEEADYPSSLVIGGQSRGATTEQMAAAYAIYGNGGQYKAPRYYSRVLDSQGNVVMTADNYTIQAVSEDTAYIMNKLLYNVMNMSGGTANGMGVNGFETIGKTGTTSNDKDRWFVGMTPYYVGAIWWGYDLNYEIDYSPAASTNGTTVPWKTVMDQIHEGLPEKEFPAQPEGVQTAAFCRDTGLLATDECGNRGTGYYKTDYMPEYCVGHSDIPEEAAE